MKRGIIKRPISTRKLNFRRYSNNPKEGRKGRTEVQNKEDSKQANNKILDLNPAISIITLNVKGLHISLRRWRFSSWREKQVPTAY